MKFDWKIFGFLLPIFFSSFTLTGQNFEIKPQTYEAEGNKESLLLPKKDPNALPDYLQKEFFENTPDPVSAPKSFEQNIDMGIKEDFLDNSEEYLSRLQPTKEEKGTRTPLMYNYLGDYKTESKKLIVLYRDYGKYDGDVVTVLLNDSEFKLNLLLENAFKKLDIVLFDGLNKIDFIATSAGFEGPNTAEVRVYDQNQKLIMSNQWTIDLNGKATLVIVKE